MMGRRLEGGADLSPEAARRILERRAEALAQPLEEPAAPRQMLDLLVFSCAGGAYAVGAPHVVEVVSLGDPTPVPGTPAAVLGVVNHRGRILPVIDVGRLLSLPDDLAPDPGLLIVVTAGEAAFGIRAEAVLEIVQVEEHEVLTADRFAEEHDSVVRGLTETMVAILDVEAMAHDPRISVNDQVE